MLMDYRCYRALAAHSQCRSDAWTARRGAFDPMMHVLELSSEISSVLNGDAMFERLRIGDPKLLAFATYLHETVHWWQHTSTTAGLISALSRAAQAHVIRRALKSVPVDEGSLVKPAYVACMRPDSPAKSYENLAVNGWMDIEFGSLLLGTPEAARMVVRNPFFESVGQSYFAYMADVLGLIRATIGGSSLISDFTRGYGSFESLIEARVEGYSPNAARVMLPGLGLRAIQEGQARFAELQFRHMASGGRESWAEFAAQGLLEEEYLRAFEIFLITAKLDRPGSPISPEVNLFLLVCDLAMMPSVGYPDEILDFSGFIEAVSPGTRFLELCGATRLLGSERGEILAELTQPNASTYRAVSARLCSSFKGSSPLQVAETIAGWVSEDSGAGRMMRNSLAGRVEASTSVAYFYGRHLAAMVDRVARPDFFCWPAYSLILSQEASSAETETLMRRNGAPFVRNGESGGVGVARYLGIDRASAGELSSGYFEFQMLYDLGGQWIAAPGHFDFDFAWADPRWSAVQYREWLTPAFERFYGRRLDSVVRVNG